MQLPTCDGIQSNWKKILPVLVALGQLGFGTTRKCEALIVARFLGPPAAPRRCLAAWCSVWMTLDPKIFFISFSGFKCFVSMLKIDLNMFFESSFGSEGRRFLWPAPSSGISPRRAFTSRTLRSISSPYWNGWNQFVQGTILKSWNMI